MNITIKCENKRERVLRDGVRRIGGHAGHRDAKLARRMKINVVEASAAKSDQTHAAACKFFQNGAVNLVVHESANCFRIVRESGCFA